MKLIKAIGMTMIYAIPLLVNFAIEKYQEYDNN